MSFLLEQSQVIMGNKYRISILTPSLLRFEYSDTNTFEDGMTQLVQNRDFPRCDYTLIDGEEELEIITSELHLHYDKDVFSASGLTITMLPRYTDYGDTWRYGEPNRTLKGTARTLDTVDGEIELEDGIVARCGYAVLDDSESFKVAPDSELKFRVPEKDFYFFGYQHNYLAALQDFYKLTGETPLIPRYALGNWWSRYWKYTDQTYLELIAKFEKKGIPISIGIIDMDWHLTQIPKRFGSSWTGYTWNTEFFPNPEKFLSQLHDKGLKIGLNVHPAEGIRAYESSYPQVAKRLDLDVKHEQPAVFDLTNPMFREAYFEDVHHPIERQGVDFWWIDWQQGNVSKKSGLDPLWLLNYYHYNDNKKEKDGLVLSRYAGPGSHRYPIGFSGDTVISWKSLQFQPYFTATASNIGFGWWSHDIDGHMSGTRDEELSLRWLQLGVYSPINRLHSSNSSFNSKEPWRYSKEVEQAMIKVLRERQCMIPYLYTMNVRASSKGIPLVLPMYYLEPESNAAYQCQNEYLFGNQLMVAPITQPASNKYKFAVQNVWFPEGDWYDFYTGWKYSGESRLNVYRELDQIPVFAKAGAIIPVANYNSEQNFGAALPDKIVWKVFPGQSNHFDMVEDTAQGRCVTTLTVNWNEQTVQLTNQGNLEILPSNRESFIQLMGNSNSEIEKIEIGETKGLNKLLSDFSVEGTLKHELWDRIDKPWISYDLKEYLWKHLNLSAEISKNINILNDSCDDFLNGMLYELLYIVNSFKLC